MKYELSLLILSRTFLILILNGCKTKAHTPGEGYIEVDGGKMWYCINGEGNKRPILLLQRS